MELNELIEAVKAAQDKAALEALVKAELQIDLDKRKSLETLRAEVLKGLGVEEGGESGDQSGAAGGTGEQQGEAGSAPAGEGDTAGQHSANEQDELLVLRDENARLREENAELLSELQAAQLQISDLEASRHGGVSGSALTPPALDDAGEELAPPAVDGARLLRNTENGRDFAWTPDLAKLPHMKEL